MSETGATQPKFMRDSIRNAIEAHLASSGGGFVQAFVYAAEAVDSEGRSVMYLGGPLDQETPRSLGLSEYLSKWFDNEARELIAHSTGSCCQDCDEDEE